MFELRARGGRDPLTGRYHQVSRTFHGTKREADLALAKFVTEVAERVLLLGDERSARFSTSG